MKVYNRFNEIKHTQWVRIGRYKEARHEYVEYLDPNAPSEVEVTPCDINDDFLYKLMEHDTLVELMEPYIEHLNSIVEHPGWVLYKGNPYTEAEMLERIVSECFDYKYGERERLI